MEQQILVRDKMKLTNSDQYNRLVEFMVENPIAASYFTMVKTPNDRIDYDQIWQNITTELNVLGPPVRTMEEWKKVWKDYKYHTKKKFNIKQKIKQKIAIAEKPINGPFNYKTINFNRNELAVLKLLDLTASNTNRKYNTNNTTLAKKTAITITDVQENVELPVIKIEPEDTFLDITDVGIDFIDTFSPPSSPTNHREIQTTFTEIEQDEPDKPDDIESHIRKLKLEKLEILKRAAGIEQQHLELKEKMFDLKKRKFEQKCQQFNDKYNYKMQKLELKKRELELKKAAKFRKEKRLQIEK